MKNITENQNKALEKAFNSKVVQNMKPGEYKGYIQLICCLSLSTIIKNKGHKFVKEFVEEALNNTEPVPVVTQYKPH